MPGFPHDPESLNCRKIFDTAGYSRPRVLFPYSARGRRFSNGVRSTGSRKRFQRISYRLRVVGTVAIAQQPLVGAAAPDFMMPEKCPHQGVGDRLPSLATSFLPQPDQALTRVEIQTPQCQRTADPAGLLGVEAQQQSVELRIVSGASGYLVDFGQNQARDGPAARWPTSGSGQLSGRTATVRNMPVVLGLAIQAPQRGDCVLCGHSASAIVAADQAEISRGPDQLFAISGGGLVDRPVGPARDLENSCPAALVCLPCPSLGYCGEKLRKYVAKVGRGVREDEPARSRSSGVTPSLLSRRAAASQFRR